MHYLGFTDAGSTAWMNISSCGWLPTMLLQLDHDAHWYLLFDSLFKGIRRCNCQLCSIVIEIHRRNANRRGYSLTGWDKCTVDTLSDIPGADQCAFFVYHPRKTPFHLHQQCRTSPTGETQCNARGRYVYLDLLWTDDI